MKSYMLMLLKGVVFCHENSTMHRVLVRTVFEMSCVN